MILRVFLPFTNKCSEMEMGFDGPLELSILLTKFHLDCNVHGRPSIPIVSRKGKGKGNCKFKKKTHYPCITNKLLKVHNVNKFHKGV